MKALEDLAKREMAVLDQAKHARGYIEQKFAALRAGGVFAESSAVHAAYVGLASPASESLEALKRAVFLGWYAYSEPGCFTGIGDLNPAQESRAHELLESAHLGGRIDPEFTAMLGWYWSVSEEYFELVSRGRLLKYLASLNPVAYETYGFTRAGLEGRGQMGVYLSSVWCRAA